jgi:hypothetical protein
MVRAGVHTKIEEEENREQRVGNRESRGRYMKEHPSMMITGHVVFLAAITCLRKLEGADLWRGIHGTHNHDVD